MEVVALGRATKALSLISGGRIPPRCEIVASEAFLDDLAARCPSTYRHELQRAYDAFKDQRYVAIDGANAWICCMGLEGNEVHIHEFLMGFDGTRLNVLAWSEGAAVLSGGYKEAKKVMRSRKYRY